MTPYDRICADVHGNIDNEAVKGIIRDLYHWDDNSKPQAVEGSFAIDDPQWRPAKCIVQLIEKDSEARFTPALVSDLSVTSTDDRLQVSLIAITGSDDYTRETGHIVEVVIASKDCIPETHLATLGTETTIGALTALPDELADYADLPIAIESHATTAEGTTITGFIPCKDV